MKKITLLMTGILAVSVICAQDSQTDNQVRVIYPSEFKISKPLTEISEVDPIEEKSNFVSRDKEHRTPQVFKYSVKDGAEYGNDPNSIQTVMGNKQVAAPLTNWLGQNGGGSCPPDPTGAAGLTQYVQSVNATPYKVYNKTTGVVTKTGSIGTLFGSSINDGDPIVLYDKYADRWVLTQFGDNYGASGNKIHIAISQTSDATGAYYLYTYTDTQFPDYLKFSIWADGYYMTSNEGTDKVFCFERTAMLAGTPTARSISKTFTGAPAGFFAPMPADADGGLPPAGTPLPFFTYNDNGTMGGTDGIKIWNMTVSWGATPTATISTATTIATAAFDASYDTATPWADIAQGSGSQKLDGIGGILSYRAQWRKWATYNSVVLCWPIKISASQRSIKWVELRQTGTTWSLYQQGTYAPDALNRWLGSIAMDDNGSIALCYAVAGPSPATPVSLRYTGRLASDPAGTMSFAEQSAVTGSGVLTACGERFGDYSQTTLDPDGLTFWHTGEYVAGGQPATRIYSFKLPLGTVGIGENEIQPSFNVYQTENVLNFAASKLPSDEEMVVDLFDIEGRQISGKSIKPVSNKFETTIDVSGLAKGTYLVRVGNPNFQRVVKVIVN